MAKKTAIGLHHFTVGLGQTFQHHQSFISQENTIAIKTGLISPYAATPSPGVLLVADLEIDERFPAHLRHVQRGLPHCQREYVPVEAAETGVNFSGGQLLSLRGSQAHRARSRSSRPSSRVAYLTQTCVLVGLYCSHFWYSFRTRSSSPNWSSMSVKGQALWTTWESVSLRVVLALGFWGGPKAPSFECAHKSSSIRSEVTTPNPGTCGKNPGEVVGGGGVAEEPTDE